MTAECASILETLHEVAGETTQWQIVETGAAPMTILHRILTVMVFASGAATLVLMAFIVGVWMGWL
jgi:hypothetical protein